jgi:phospholipid/cholesterol/gamma-HCH transport system substrate-binding protein
VLTRLTRIQLSIFAVITVLTVMAITVFYLQLPAALGVGVYTVTADFASGGGLYPNANVTYHGVTVGRVEAVDLSNDGVSAEMRINAGPRIPANVTATVKSVSAIGEQYVDLVPQANASTQLLRDTGRIDRQNTGVGQDIAGLLRNASQLVSSVGDSRIKELLHETFRAFNGSGPQLARLIRSARQLVQEANANAVPTTQLIDQAGPFLDAQIRSGDDIKSLSESLARLTGDIRQADPRVRSVLAAAPGAADEASAAFAGFRPSFTMLAANLANLGRVGVIYHKSIEQILVIFPALFAALMTVAGQESPDEGVKLDFKIDLGDPLPCAVGFIPASQIRSPADETLRELPTDMYCKVPQGNPSVVRGARNYPCQEFPGKRAPTIQLCRDPRGYVPIGSNPWRGPPIPTGTPVTDPRNILPPNKFPYVPPGVDPDPGTPTAGPLPPGVQEGPGPAPYQPWPVQPPPNDGPPPPPLTAWIPPAPYPPQLPGIGPLPPAPLPPPPPPPGPDAALPAETPAAMPQASAATPSVATYDAAGTFIDPTVGTSQFAPGITDAGMANWVDLMLDPRKA